MDKKTQLLIEALEEWGELPNDVKHDPELPGLLRVFDLIDRYLDPNGEDKG